VEGIDQSGSLELIELEGYWHSIESPSIPIVSPTHKMPNFLRVPLLSRIALIENAALTPLHNEDLIHFHKDCRVYELTRKEDSPQKLKLDRMSLPLHL
jgi:hypothetical protein